jgi:drug/metabolite transporter (DMT)-like permease
MWKGVITIFIGTMIISIGNGLLSKGLRELQRLDWEGSLWSVGLNYFLAAVNSPAIVFGVICHALFFGSLLMALSWGDLSLILPITAFTYVFGALIAQYYLNEDVDSLRWIGSIIIMIGVFIVLIGQGRNEGLI